MVPTLDVVATALEAGPMIGQAARALAEIDLAAAWADLASGDSPVVDPEPFTLARLVDGRPIREPGAI